MDDAHAHLVGAEFFELTHQGLYGALGIGLDDEGQLFDQTILQGAEDILQRDSMLLQRGGLGLFLAETHDGAGLGLVFHDLEVVA